MNLTKNSDLVCNIDLNWYKKDNLCKDIVKNNPQSLRYHIINKHGFSIVPHIALKECNSDEEIYEKTKLYLDEPKQWWLDNQIIWTAFRNLFFKKTPSNKGKNKMTCKDHFEHIWIKGKHFPLLKCKKCAQSGRIVILEGIPE